MAEQTRNADILPMNEKIMHRTVQLISADGRNVGPVSRDEALRMAREAGLDLVLLSEKAGEAPVAKIMDYGKAIYAKKKQQATSRKKQKLIQIKELQISPKIGEHDFMTKINHALEFLSEGKHVKIVFVSKGREAASRDVRGAEMFAKIDKIFADTDVAGKSTGRDKDLKTATTWSRVYFRK